MLSDTTYRATDSIRLTLRRMLHEAGHNPQTRIEVEDVETAVELIGRGLADTVRAAGRGPGAGAAAGSRRHLDRHCGPRSTRRFAIVHRVNATLSPTAA